MDAVEKIGYPECRLALTQAIIFIAVSPKSDSVTKALTGAISDAALPVTVPAHLCDSHYSGHEQLGRGVGYRYPHDFEGHFVQQQYLPDQLIGKQYYVPTAQGAEKKIKEKKDHGHY